MSRIRLIPNGSDTSKTNPYNALRFRAKATSHRTGFRRSVLMNHNDRFFGHFELSDQFSVSSKIEAYNVEPRKWNSTSLAPGLMTEMKYVVDPSLFC